MSPTQLRVRPASGPLREGERYLVQLALRDANTSDIGNSSNNFTIGPIAFQVRPAVVMPYSAQASNLSATNGTTGASSFNFADTRINLTWTAAANAERYEIYARDTGENPSFVLLQTVLATANAPRLTATVEFLTVPTSAFPFKSFDTFEATTAIEPFGFGNQVTLAVAAVDRYGNRAPLSAAPTVTLRDTVPPVASSLSRIADGRAFDAINDTNQPVSYRFRIAYSEPMDPATASTPTFTSNAATAPLVSFAWDPPTSSTAPVWGAVLTLTIPPSTAMSDSTGIFIIRGGKDSSGNELAGVDLTGVMGGRRELVTNSTFQAGTTCNLNGWQNAVTGTAPTPVAVSNNDTALGSTGTCAAVVGSLPSTTPTTGRARIFQDVALPSIANTNLVRLRDRSSSTRLRDERGQAQRVVHSQLPLDRHDGDSHVWVFDGSLHRD